MSAMLAYVRLYRRGQVELAYPTVLARFAIAHFRGGRRVGVKSNCHDVLSPYAQRKKARIEHFGCAAGQPLVSTSAEGERVGSAIFCYAN